MTITSVTAVARPSTAADADAISAVLASAFTDDPVFIWMIPDVGRRAAILPDLFAPFAEAYQPLGASHVIARDGRTAGAALWAPPGKHAVGEDDADTFMARIEQVSGPDAGRIFEVMNGLDEHHPTADCYYLNLLGVDEAHHGRGLGSALLAATLRRCEAEAAPAYLEATSPRNRRLYARHGFEVVGEIALPDGPSLWPMWREPARVPSRSAD
jgi:GNAT superfamily N-acetyltransferase